MNSLNSILLEGNLVRDPELSNTPKGTTVCKFSIASNRFYKIENEYQKEVSFFNVTTWAKLAVACGDYLQKGRGVRVIGRLKQERWKGEDGKGRSRVHIVADHVEFRPQFNKKEETDDNLEESGKKLQTAVSF